MIFNIIGKAISTTLRVVNIPATLVDRATEPGMTRGTKDERFWSLPLEAVAEEVDKIFKEPST